MSVTDAGSPYGLQGTPAEWSLCTHTVLSERPYCVSDNTADPVHAGNPLLTMTQLRSYAGVPLQDDSGHTLGSHCVLDPAPRTFGDADLAILAPLGRANVAESERLDVAAIAASIRARGGDAWLAPSIPGSSPGSGAVFVARLPGALTLYRKKTANVTHSASTCHRRGCFFQRSHNAATPYRHSPNRPPP